MEQAAFFVFVKHNRGSNLFQSGFPLFFKKMYMHFKSAKRYKAKAIIIIHTNLSTVAFQ